MYTTIELSDACYPARLGAIVDPPRRLYCDGSLDPLDSQSIAIVGSRQATAYGLTVARSLAQELSALGMTIVSGLARGIDGAAHEGALRAGGRTIAVLGCGIDVLYPQEHDRLRGQIVESGAVLSELPLGTPPLPSHFPRRNRIISGLSLGVVIVEAAEDSGSLITARLALEQGREVFAVPGPITSRMSKGAHYLLKQGAKLTETVDDIIEELLPQLEGRMEVAGTRTRRSFRPEPPDLTPEERTVYSLVSGAPVTIDELTERATLQSSAVARALLALELKDVVRQLPGQRYCLA
jgi:DNA processing protein